MCSSQADRTMERETVKTWTQVNYIKELSKGLKENWEMCGLTLCVCRQVEAGEEKQGECCMMT